MPFNPFSALTSKIFGGLALMLALALGVQTWRLSAAQEALEHKRTELATCEARHAVTRGSVARLEAIVVDLNEQAEKRAKAFAEAQELARERDAAMDRLARTSSATIDKLNELAKRPGQCPTPDDLRELAEGL